MPDFHNPYHFVPVEADTNHPNWKDNAKEYNKRQECPYLESGHSRYRKGAYHGRITCWLTTKTPIFIGGSRYQQGTEDSPARVAPYELGGNPAIPATTLRGMISAIAEAASHSAMRVLENKVLSWRKEATPPQILSALGMVIVKQNKNNKDDIKYFLRPLVLPTLRKNNRGAYVVDDSFKKMFVEKNTPRLKVYIKPPGGAETYKRDAPVFYFMNLNKHWSFEADETLQNHKQLRNPCRGRAFDDRFVIGQRPYNNANTAVQEEEATDEQKEQWVRGIIRIMGEGRDMPETRKHEIFIPYPEEAEKWKDFPIQPQALEKFHKIADERTESSEDLPYHPIGTRRNPVRHKNNIRLKSGDIVYFKPNEDGEEVAEISFSAIWRDGPKNGDGTLATLHDFFDDQELLPFNKSREKLSPAERVFGFVDERLPDRKSDKESDIAAAYAGHVRFTAARWNEQLPDGADSPYLDEVTLKILDSPKPPSPALYFRSKTGSSQFIAKSSLDPAKHKLQGRKFYLHKQNIDADDEPWKTDPDNEQDRPKQKSRITPLRKGLTFKFHIDFDNLDKFELGMLLYALSPNDDFLHKIGMGKPLGLGSVKLKIDSVKTIDRKERYCEKGPFSEDRFVDLKEWPSLRDHFEREAKTISEVAIQALEMLGNPGSVKAPVHYPQVAGAEGKNMELENYRWWVANDNPGRHANPPPNGGQRLEPLDETNDDEMPKLLRLRYRP